ncbi:hypothetical protein F2Q68_00045342 [Brassica cretica]|uniref:Uncharacterized protein n=1 Tax=Brassica cretica TaxID=69181 RepID=A0A8S9LKZ7_BRACR|nr:hypothetical protein F2Q68_00045342 [Brassica cretica]
MRIKLSLLSNYPRAGISSGLDRKQESLSIDVGIVWAIDSVVVPSIDVEVVTSIDVEVVMSVDVKVVSSVDVEVVPSVDVEVLPSVDVEVLPSVDVEVASSVPASSTQLNSPNTCSVTKLHRDGKLVPMLTEAGAFTAQA